MNKIRLLALLACLPAAAQSQMEMAMMQKWAAVDVVKYHIVGVHDFTVHIAGNGAGLADVKDRVVIDLTWKLSEMKLVVAPTFQNTKSTVSNLRDREPTCLPPVLEGEYEFYELLSVKNGLGGALEFQVKTTHPIVEVAQSRTASRKAVPAYVRFAMPMPKSDDLAATPDKKSFIVKKDGWVWTWTPTPGK
jgi:hypothetical protein